ncbi:hypothetical protein SEA_LIBERTYBELL_66 [Streptomyces phage LibertyBell]|nr:hypothetical protein SEA_LIBERTYBELL_66 [Streptomyces phage LibertyBell]
MQIKKVRLDVPPIEAVQITKENIIEVAAWAGGVVKKYRAKGGVYGLRIVIPTETGLIEGENHYIGDWLIRNPETPGLVSALNNEMFRKIYTETEPVNRAELAEIIETVMTTPSRSVRSLAYEAANRVFERIEQKLGKKVQCLQCKEILNFRDMAAKADGDPSSFCKPCEAKEIERLTNYKTRNGGN